MSCLFDARQRAHTLNALTFLVQRLRHLPPRERLAKSARLQEAIFFQETLAAATLELPISGSRAEYWRVKWSDDRLRQFRPIMELAAHFMVLHLNEIGAHAEQQKPILEPLYQVIAAVTPVFDGNSD